MNLNRAVQELRRVAGESQQSFAQRLGLSMRAIANYEKDRVPNGPALFRLAKLARQIGRADLSQIFSSALSEEFHEALEPMTPEEKVWSDAVLALLRNRDLTDWLEVGRFLVGALERLLKRKSGEEIEDLAAVLALAREIWGNDACMNEREIGNAMAVVCGDVNRAIRDENRAELRKEIGNMILSSVRWADDLGFDLEECLKDAELCQCEFVRKHRS